MVDAYILVFAGLLLTMGSLGDRFGRKRALQIGIVLFGLSSLFAAFAESTAQLIGARALMGIGGALIMPATLSILTDVSRGRNAAGPLVFGWRRRAGHRSRPDYRGTSPGELLVGFRVPHQYPDRSPCYCRRTLDYPGSRDPRPVPVDFPGAVLSISAISALVFAIIEAPARGWTDGLVVACFVGGVALAAAFITWEIRTQHPMLNLAFFKNPRFSAGAGAIAIGFSLCSV